VDIPLNPIKSPLNPIKHGHKLPEAKPPDHSPHRNRTVKAGDAQTRLNELAALVGCPEWVKVGSP